MPVIGGTQTLSASMSPVSTSDFSSLHVHPLDSGSRVVFWLTTGRVCGATMHRTPEERVYTSHPALHPLDIPQEPKHADRQNLGDS